LYRKILIMLADAAVARGRCRVRQRGAAADNAACCLEPGTGANV